MNCMFYKISKIVMGQHFGKMKIERVYPVYARGEIFLNRDKNQAARLNQIFADE